MHGNSFARTVDREAQFTWASGRIPPGGVRITVYPQNAMCFKFEHSDGKVIITAHATHDENPLLAGYLGADHYKVPGESLVFSPAELGKLRRPVVLLLYRDIWA